MSYPESFQKVQNNTDYYESAKGAVPHVLVEGGEELEVRLFGLGHPHENADVARHEGFGEVHSLLSL